MQCNISVYCDMSHGANNDVTDTIKTLSLFPFWLLMMIVANVQHGPWGEDLRWNQVTEAWSECHHRFSCKNCPLFQSYCKQILDELEQSGIFIPDAGEDQEECLWQYMAKGDILERKGTKA
eukprot:1444191-Lingulodinium_polyedra.AAC.1